MLKNKATSEEKKEIEINNICDVPFLFSKPIPHDIIKHRARNIKRGDPDDYITKRINVPPPVKGSPDYGKNKPLVIAAMLRIGKACTFAEIQEITQLDKSTVRKWVNFLQKNNQVKKVRDATRGQNKLCSLWKLI